MTEKEIHQAINKLNPFEREMMGQIMLLCTTHNPSPEEFLSCITSIAAGYARTHTDLTGIDYLAFIERILAGLESISVERDTH